MRILMTTDVAGGVWSYTEELVDLLIERGHRVTLVSFGGDPGAAHEAWLANRGELDFRAYPHPLEWMPEPEPGLSASVEALRREVVRFSPEVLHLNQFHCGAYDFGPPKLVVAHSDVLTWWRHVKGEEPPRDSWFQRYRDGVEAGLRGAQARLAPSAWMAAQIEAEYGVEPVGVVYNARSPERFRVRRRGVREPLVVTIGRLWDEGKGVRDLIEAAPELSGAAQVVVAGPVEHPGGGEGFPVDVPGVHWAGELGGEEIRALLGRARVYAATSRYEPFGLALVEAALAGCALVATDIGTFRELWDGCAVFYPPGDSRALAEAVKSLMADESRRTALAEAARARALERYHPERMVDEYEALYRRLAARSSAVQRVPAR